MNMIRWTVALLLIVIAQIAMPVTSAQVGTPEISLRNVGWQVRPGYGAGFHIVVSNTTDTPILVSGARLIDLLAPEECPRHWFGDAGYPDRPRGENETTPPEPAYPLPWVWLDSPVILEPGEVFESPLMELFMISAAPRSCENQSFRAVPDATWEFVVTQTYGTVSGTITDSTSGEPLTSATVSITGTTDTGVATEELAVDATGSYTSTIGYHTGTELTVTGSNDGYVSASNMITVAEGPNSVNHALEKTPVATGTISGTVVDSDTSAPMGNTSIVITGTDADGAPVTQTISTDADGRFSSDVEFLAGSTVHLSISADGYVSTETVIESLDEGKNTVASSLTAEQVEEPTQTPTPSPTETVTPSPELTETVTPTPDLSVTETPDPEPSETESPLATPIVDDAEPTSPTRGGNAVPAQPVVSGLPSTGSGGATPVGVVIGGAIASAAMIAIAIRRQKQ